jgi:hypothetical protein
VALSDIDEEHIQRFRGLTAMVAKSLKEVGQTPQYFPGSKDEIVSELVQRREQLRADTEQQVKQIEDAGEGEIGLTIH